MSDPSPRPNGSNSTRWIAVVVVLALGAAFTGAYTFFSNFATKGEVDIIRTEQQRRTSTVYEVPRRLDEFQRQVELLRLDVKQLELTVAELGAALRQGRSP